MQVFLPITGLNLNSNERRILACGVQVTLFTQLSLNNNPISFSFQIKVDDDGKIVEARFKTFGCGSAIASSSLATEWIKGKSVNIGLTICSTQQMHN